VSLSILLLWLGTPAILLRAQLKSLQFWWLEACVALGLALSVPTLAEMRRHFVKADARRMTLLALAALVLTLFVAPRTNRIYYDEQIYQSIGQNLSDLRLAQMCNDGTVEYGRLQCFSGEYNKQPYAYPHLLSLFYRAFGVGPSMAFAVNAVVMAVTVCAVYALALLLFNDHRAGWFAGLLILLIPHQLLWSATAAVEPSAALACTMAVLLAAHFSRTTSTTSLAAAGVAAAYAVQFRPESMLIAGVLALMLWRHRSELGRQRFWWVALLVLLLLAVHAGHMAAVRHEGWGTADARLSFGYLRDNLRVNGWFYLGDGRFPFLITLLAIGGAAGQGFRFERLAVSLWFVLFFGIFLLFYAGSYNYGADVRYSVMTYAPLAVLGGVGAASLARWVDERSWRAVGLPAVTAALVFQFLWYAPLVRATTEEAWAARADVRFARSLVPQLSGNAYVLTHNPGMFHVWGVNAGQMSRAVADPGYPKALATRYSQGVYLHWNFWCNVLDPIQQAFCRKALEANAFEVMAEHREGDQRYAFYRLLAEPRGDVRGDQR
jgi:hypothetical protein